VKLILAGGKGWYYDTVFALVEALGMTEAVLFPGFIPSDELPDWYRAAELFVYPSLLEGFGLPVLEAMACGIPVVCSQADGLLEVVGSAAVTFAAEDEAALTSILRSLSANPAQRAHLRTLGLAQAAHFAWRKAAQQMLALYGCLH